MTADDTALARELLDVVTRERQRVAARLHDGPVQDLTAAHLFLETALMALPADAPSRPNVEGAARNLRSAVERARSLMRSLTGPGDVTDLRRLMADMAAGVAPEADVVVAVPDAWADEPAVGLPEAVTVALRVAEELLHNVRRHADGRLDRLELRADERHVVLAVVDRGPGGLAGRRPPAAPGLRSVHAQARAAGGTVEIDAGAGGTAVTVTIPHADGD